jgi:hypothetical protein
VHRTANLTSILTSHHQASVPESTAAQLGAWTVFARCVSARRPRRESDSRYLRLVPRGPPSETRVTVLLFLAATHTVQTNAVWHRFVPIGRADRCALEEHHAGFHRRLLAPEHDHLGQLASFVRRLPQQT